MLLLIPLVVLTMAFALFIGPVFSQSHLAMEAHVAQGMPLEWHYTKAGVVYFNHDTGASRFYPYDQLPAYDRRRTHSRSTHLSA